MTRNKPTATESSDDNRRKLGMTIGEVSRAWRFEINRRLKSLGLNQSTQQVLMHLHRSPQGLMQRELARKLDVEGPTVVRLLDLLEEKNWIKRVPSSDDKRRKYCLLTAEARKQVVMIEKVLAELRAQMMTGLSDDEVDASLDLMRRMRDNLLDREQ